MDEDGEDSDGLPDVVAVHGIEQEKKNLLRLSSQSPPTAIETQTDSTASDSNVDYLGSSKVDQQLSDLPSPPPVSKVDSRTNSLAVEPAMMCSDCGEPCATSEAFEIHLLEKHSVPYAPRFSSSQPLNPISPSLPKDSSSKVQEHANRYKNVLKIHFFKFLLIIYVKLFILTLNFRLDSIATEPKHSSLRAVEVKLPAVNHWNRGSDLQYSQQLHSATTSSLPLPSTTHFQMPSIWLPRPAFNNFTSLNSLPGMPPPPWHQDPAAMAWIASRHMMLPLTLAGQSLPHNYSISHSQTRDPNGVLPPLRLYPISSSASASVPVVEDIFPCEICGKTFPLKETLRQVSNLFEKKKRLFFYNNAFFIFSTMHSFSTCWLMHNLAPSFASFAMLDSPLKNTWSRT